MLTAEDDLNSCVVLSDEKPGSFPVCCYRDAGGDGVVVVVVWW